MAAWILIFSILLRSSISLALEGTTARAQCNQWLRNPITNAVATQTAANSIHFEVDQVQIRWDHDQVVSTPLRAEVTQSYFPYNPFLGEQMTVNGSTYTITDIGPRQKRADVTFINKAFEEAQTPYRNWQNIDLIFTGNKKQAEETLDRLRNGIFNKVERDLLIVNLVGDQIGMNSDTLVVLKGVHSDLAHISTDEFTEKALLTATLTRLDSISFVLPSSVMEMQSTLYENRLPKVSKNGKNSRIGVISHYAKFGAVAPQVHAMMIMRIFELAKDPLAPIDVLLVTANSRTKKLFSKYRFREISYLNTGKDGEGEYLMYLETKADDFQKTYRELIERTERF
jgi:hypothetical protein